MECLLCLNLWKKVLYKIACILMFSSWKFVPFSSAKSVDINNSFSPFFIILRGHHFELVFPGTPALHSMIP